MQETKRSAAEENSTNTTTNKKNTMNSSFGNKKEKRERKGEEEEEERRAEAHTGRGPWLQERSIFSVFIALFPDFCVLSRRPKWVERN